MQEGEERSVPAQGDLSVEPESYEGKQDFSINLKTISKNNSGKLKSDKNRTKHAIFKKVFYVTTQNTDVFRHGL